MKESPLIYDGKKCSRNFRNVSPGHIELWFFGWTPLNYRSTFPLYPLPIVAFMPFIANSIKPFESNFKADTPITITLDPRRNSMVINNNLKCPQVYKLPFIGVENFLELKNTALQFKPDPALFNHQIYNEHIMQAYEKATVILRDKKCRQKMEAKEAIACNNK